MPRPYASGVVPASADAVWEVVRAFDGLPSWHPAIATSEVVSGAEGQVGAVRRLTLGDGGVVVERLLTLDDVDRSYTYAFDGPDSNPFGVRRYVSTVRIAPVTDTGHAFVEWWSEYDAEAADEAKLDELFAGGVYGGGIATLRERFS
ncbi:MAG: SRPBCC family protein [Pseudonocardia sp.]|uniref:SRPBCC family protein n=1 Tax=Pseudonocardia sp. TaxID=60912 RepID=UPI001ACD632C|nr:SRPBCC family protein [Pseudonocardia sp.]MBN9099028.1 SRPBCC family protein [Pseudonocardia sp.]